MVPLTNCGDLIMLLAIPTKVCKVPMILFPLVSVVGYPIDFLPESQTPGTSVLFGMT